MTPDFGLLWVGGVWGPAYFYFLEGEGGQEKGICAYMILERSLYDKNALV